jgi:hypothetical protein
MPVIGGRLCRYHCHWWYDVVIGAVRFIVIGGMMLSLALSDSLSLVVLVKTA